MPRPKKSASPPPPAPSSTPFLNLAVAKVVAAVRKSMGADAPIARLDKAYPEIKHTVSTGLPGLDAVLGAGGIPLGKAIEIYGPESVGKSTLCTYLAGQCQAQGIMPAEFHTELGGDLKYAVGLGLDPEQGVGGAPRTMEEVFELIERTAIAMEEAKVPGVCFWDSIAATPLASELALGYDEEGRMMARAQFLSKKLPKLVERLRSGMIGFVFVNQVREVIGATAYQKQTRAPGGRAWRHWAHLRLEMSSRGLVKSGERVIGIKSSIKVVKSKIGIPWREAIIDILFDPQPTRIVESTAPARMPMGKKK